MRIDLEKHIEDAMERIKKGANLNRLLEEYTTKLELKHAFYIITQAQIRAMKNKNNF
tara:strand:+ start:399 stop:569 length:171 start_codon:yes stop_codon:yes gene_type:complete